MHMIFRPLTLLFLATLLVTSSKAINFVFNYNDAPGVGFNHSTQGAERRAGLEYAASKIGQVFRAYSADIEIDVDGSVTEDSALAGAAANYNFVPNNNGFDGRGDVELKILGGNAADPNSGSADAEISWNFQDFSWEIGTDFQVGEYDFISTAMHELLHTVGFSSDMLEDGSSYYDAIDTPTIWAPMDKFIGDRNGVLIDSNFVLNSGVWTSVSTGGTGTVPANLGLYFHGPNAMTAFGGNPVPLYSPTTWEDGSSVSHFDTDYFDGINAPELLMNHAAPDGIGIREVDPLTVAFLQDIGFTQASIVPEASTLAFLLISLGSLTFIRRRS